MVTQTPNEGWASVPKYIVGVIVGALVFVVVPETVRWLHGGAFAQSPPVTGGGVIQNNQNAPNFNVPGSGNQFNIYPPQQQSVADDAIYQAGTVVGKAYGGRRRPNDATRFEFREITNCAQFNTRAPFTYGGAKLLFESEENSALMVAGRPDSPIRFGVIARVLD